ncbi:conjugal transfer protein MobB [Chryseobacterium sp. ISL-6]|uniref:conjugal transfer protein MobB n=1 Tax=Chryseobacterium sp. ISL-6 TaxID=2819143 RepID=UPI001BEAE972|nr:conjugal transfer protein MobB [Chryseobacterium sp. ISL-6]MBT2623730.1 relaxase/mobilization nuclease domain-containing protein [Chryseobacterium sp. ISL-6]
MIAKIGRTSNLYGVLAYNNVKVERDNGKILTGNKMIETLSGHYTVAQLAASFEPYLIANRNTEKHTLHISLNPDPNDQVSDDQFIQLAQEYMNEMGYGEQPYVIFKHTDIDRTHIHIVSVCVDEEGKKISDKFEKRRSMEVCRELERKYGLMPAGAKKLEKNEKNFQPVDYKSGNVKDQIASVIKHLPRYYQFQTFGQYNALLSLFNISVEKVESELHKKMHLGLMYFPLDKNGERIGHPFKASLFGKSTELNALESHFIKCKKSLTGIEAKDTVKVIVDHALKYTNNEKDFKSVLIHQGINTIVRRNATGRLYGITFIDHNSKTVWNGSGLGKDFSASIFNDLWNNNINHENIESAQHHTTISHNKEKENLHYLFDFLDVAIISGHLENNLFEDVSGLLTFTNEEDYQEKEFANQMKNRKKRKR